MGFGGKQGFPVGPVEYIISLFPIKHAQLQHGVSGQEDANLSGVNSDVLAIRNSDPTVGDILRHVMTFDLSSIPAGVTVQEAKLYLYYYDFTGPTGVAFRVHRLTQPWVESKVTWNSYDTGSPWATPGGDFAATYVEDTTLPASDPDEANVLDITGLVDWASLSIADLLFKFATEAEPLASDTEAHWDTRLFSNYSPPKLVIKAR